MFLCTHILLGFRVGCFFLLAREFTPSRTLAPDPPPHPHAQKVPVAAASAAPASVGPPVSGSGFVDYPLSEQALAIANNLTVSKQVVPHYYLTVDLK